jgi:hypothetical protein
MYRISEVFTLDTFVKFAKYIIDGKDVKAWVYDKAKEQDLYLINYIPTIGTLLFQNNFTVDFDKSAFYFSQDLIGKTVRVEYYTMNKSVLNPFYVATDTSKLISSILMKSSTSIRNGIYFYQREYDPEYIWKIASGSFMYNGRFLVYRGETLNFKELSPPTLQNFCRCYYFFINEEIIESYTNRQISTLTKLGMLKSEMYDTFDKAKLDVLSRYSALYKSEPINVGFIYLVVEQKTSNYEFWVEYDEKYRGIEV